MLDALKWWAAIQLLALIAAPLLLAVLAPLADRGWGLSKAFGLLLFAYVVWLLGVTHVAPNGPIAYGVAILLVLGGSAYFLRRSGGKAGWRAGVDELVVFLRRRRGLLLLEEAVLLASYSGFLLIRRQNPDISGTEKFMDFAFVNAVGRSVTFPPIDPWLAPSAAMPEPTINYYHFGYLMQGVLVRLTGVHPAVGFNLALSMLFGLSAIGVFSLCYGLARDLVAERARGAVGARPARPARLGAWSFRAARPYLVAGAAGVFLLLISGNLWTFLRRIDSSGLWDKDFWQGVGWNATRVLVIKQGDRDVDYTINEFPAFSFLLGDLHPHVLALPFTLLAVGLAYAWLMRPPLLFQWAMAGTPLPDHRARWRRAAPFAALIPGAVILGGLYFLNSWDFPAYFALAQAAALAGAWWLRGEDETESWGKAALAVVACGALAVALYLPFHLTFRPPVLSDEASRLPIGIVTQRSYLSQFLQFWGLQLALLVPVLGSALLWRRGGSLLPSLTGSLRRAESAAVIAREAPGWEIGLVGLAGLALIAVADRLGSGALMCALALAAGGAYGARRSLAPADPAVKGDPLAGRRPLAFAFGAICLAGLLLATCEVVYIRDFYGGALRRMNTVFKFYYQAWLLLAVGGSVASFWLYQTLRTRGAQLARWALLAGAGILVVAGLHFPLRVAWLRTEGFTAPATLNGMAWMQRFHPEDYAATEWLRVHGASAAVPAPIVLEATGGAYSEFARVATETGFPTVLGWDQHERLWRGASINEEVDRRKADADAAYSAATFDQAKQVLDKYGVSYVVVGYLEQQKYGAGGGLAKFDAAVRDGFLQKAFSQGATSVYRVAR